MHYCIIINYHLHYSIILTLTPTMNSSQTDLGESVIFQPVLQAYPTRHSWIITAHISLGNLECHWKPFNRQLTKTQQFLRSLDQHPSAPNTTIINTSTRIVQHPGHLQLWSDNNNICHKIAAIQPTTDTHPLQKRFTTFSWRCPQLAHWNSHYKRHPQH